MRIFFVLNVCSIFCICRGFSLPHKITHCGIEHCDADNLDACCISCDTCFESGTVLCEFCHGTGFFTIGNDLIGTHNHCPACNGKGTIECKTCMGAGKIANWRKKIKK